MCNFSNFLKDVFAKMKPTDLAVLVGIKIFSRLKGAIFTKVTYLAVLVEIAFFISGAKPFT